MLNRSDIDISIENASVSPERIAQSGYEGSRVCNGVHLTVTNKSEHTIRWMNVDLHLKHPVFQYTRFNSRYESDEIVTASGSEIVTYSSLRFIAPGGTAKVFVEPNSIHKRESKFWTAEIFRCYGELHNGPHFAFEVPGEKFRPMSATTRIKWCFIANAAYDSPSHPVVVELRRVRDEVLRPTKVGRAFIRGYYKKSPRVAKFISTRPCARLAIRMVLAPLAGTTKLGSNIARRVRRWREAIQRPSPNG